MACRRPSGDRHDGVAIGYQIGVSHRVPIYGAVVMRRQVHRRDDIARQNPAGRRRQRHRFGLYDRCDPRFDLAERGANGQQRTSESEAIVTQLGHRWCS